MHIPCIHSVGVPDPSWYDPTIRLLKQIQHLLRNSNRSTRSMIPPTNRISMFILLGVFVVLCLLHAIPHICPFVCSVEYLWAALVYDVGVRQELCSVARSARTPAEEDLELSTPWRWRGYLLRWNNCFSIKHVLTSVQRSTSPAPNTIPCIS